MCRYFCSVPQTLAGQKGNLCVCVGEATLKAQKPVNQEKAPSRGAVEAGSPRAGADSLMAPPQLYFGFFWRGGNNLCCFSPSRLWRVFFLGGGKKEPLPPPGGGVRLQLGCTGRPPPPIRTCVAPVRMLTYPRGGVLHFAPSPDSTPG